MDPILDKPRVPANRVLDAVLIHTEQQTAVRVKNPATRRNDPYNLAGTMRHYEMVNARYLKEKNLKPEEKSTLRFLRHEIRRINARLQPTLLRKIRYNGLVNAAANFLRRRYGNIRQHNRQLATVEGNTFVQTNTEKLQKALAAKGFQHDLQGPLTRLLEHNLSEFSIPHHEPALGDNLYNLRFKQYKDTDAYYFAGFDVLAQPTHEQLVARDAPPFRLHFDANDALNFSAKEAASMATDRPVMKTINGNDTWFIPDLAQPQGFRHGKLDVEKELGAWPIKEMATPAHRDALIYGLQSGNIRDITVTLPDKTTQEWKVAVRSDGEGLTFTDKAGKHLDPFSKLSRNEHLEKLQQRALRLRNGKGQPTKTTKGTRVHH